MTTWVVTTAKPHNLDDTSRSCTSITKALHHNERTYMTIWVARSNTLASSGLITRRKTGLSLSKLRCLLTAGIWFGENCGQESRLFVFVVLPSRCWSSSLVFVADWVRWVTLLCLGYNLAKHFTLFLNISSVWETARIVKEQGIW